MRVCVCVEARLLAAFVKQKSVSMLKWLNEKYSVKPHMRDQQHIIIAWMTAGLCPIRSLCADPCPNVACVLLIIKPVRVLWKQHYDIFGLVFAFCSRPCGTSSTLFRHLCCCHKLGIKGLLKRASSKWTWQLSQGVLMWVDMQINISHHQPVVGGATRHNPCHMWFGPHEKPGLTNVDSIYFPHSLFQNRAAANRKILHQNDIMPELFLMPFGSSGSLQNKLDRWYMQLLDCII